MEKNITEVKVGDIILIPTSRLTKYVNIKVDFIEPWRAGGRIFSGINLDNNKKVKVKVKFLLRGGITNTIEVK